MLFQMLTILLSLLLNCEIQNLFHLQLPKQQQQRNSANSKEQCPGSGALIRVTGVLAQRFMQRNIRIGWAHEIVHHVLVTLEGQEVLSGMTLRQTFLVLVCAKSNLIIGLCTTGRYFLTPCLTSWRNEQTRPSCRLVAVAI